MLQGTISLLRSGFLLSILLWGTIIASAQSPESRSQSVRLASSTVILYGIESDRSLHPVGHGYFVNPWTIATSNRLLQDLASTQMQLGRIMALDGRQFEPVSLETIDENKDLAFISTIERGPLDSQVNDAGILKPGQTVYLLRYQSGATSPADASTQNSLISVNAPLERQHRGKPVFDSTGRMIGIAMDPAVRGFDKNGMIAGKSLLPFSTIYELTSKDGKLLCPTNVTWCRIERIKTGTAEIRVKIGHSVPTHLLDSK